MQQESRYILFYGSLMSAFDTVPRLGLAQDLELISSCLIPGRLYDLGDYPALLPAQSESDLVSAELYAMAGPHVLQALDAFEDYLPDNEKDSLYLRQALKTEIVEPAAWVYIYNKPVVESGYIESGNWIEHLQRRSGSV